MSIPRLIHQTWKTSRIPRRWRRITRKLQALHPDWDYRLWTDEDNEAFVAAEYPELYDRFMSYPRPIMRADVVRYLLMHRFGGAYVDLDYEVLSRFDFGDHSVVLPQNRSRTCGDPVDSLGNCVFASVPGHPFWTAVIHELCGREHDVTVPGAVIDATGPGLLTRVHRAGSFAGVHTPDRLVYHPPSPRNALAARSLRRNGVSRGIHHPWGSWKERASIASTARSLVQLRRGRVGAGRR